MYVDLFVYLLIALVLSPFSPRRSDPREYSGVVFTLGRFTGVAPNILLIPMYSRWCGSTVTVVLTCRART
jgi:hypothetical protein